MVSCEALLCGVDCQTAPCPATHAVRAILPQQTYSFTWQPYRFDNGTLACPQGNLACLQPVPVPTGRYDMTACFSAQIVTAPGETEVVSPTDAQVIDGAQTDQSHCVAPFEIGVPGYDVRYQVYLQ